MNHVIDSDPTHIVTHDDVNAAKPSFVYSADIYVTTMCFMVDISLIFQLLTPVYDPVCARNSVRDDISRNDKPEYNKRLRYLILKEITHWI